MKPEHFALIGRRLKEKPDATQRELATSAKVSLGLVNGILKECISAGYLRQNGARNIALTEEGERYLDEFRVKNAIILAAGFGYRCAPLTFETPKGLLEVGGKPMIERQIEQLLEKGISDIIIVVGYKKESFEYLIDRYGVKFIYNPEFASKNNLASLNRASSLLGSTYILSSDNWIEENIFNQYECRSWLSCTFFDGPTDEWCVEVSPAERIKSISIGGRDSYAIIGPAYFSPSFSESFKQYLAQYSNRPGTEDYYWEHIVKENIGDLPLFINKQTHNVYEIENIEELRVFDQSYNLSSNNKSIAAISKALNVHEDEIKDIHPLSVGMTNRSYTFVCNNEKYIMRVPGEGTNKLIDRKNEYANYSVVAPLKICDDLVYIDPVEGFKISRFVDDARVCDPQSWDDVEACMSKLREFHAMKISVGHTFDLFGKISFYESLWDGAESCFRDYQETKAKVMSLEKIIDAAEKEWTLSHIDSVPDNFLFVNMGATQQIRLIDWEYAGMQDAHIDIAMFAIYSLYDREKVDALIDSYFCCDVADGIRLKIYAYISACGLLWSNWCEYKRHFGVEFGEYALHQYRYAKDYYNIVSNSDL